MKDTQQPLKTTFHLDESVIRLAESLAARYGITVQQLIETLLLECREREPAPRAPQPPAARKSPARVIEISDARRRRTDLPA